MNNIIIVGHAGRDPERRTSQAGNAVAKFSIATRRPTAEKQTDWHQCTAFGKTAELVLQYVRKGSLVCVQGSVQYTKSEERTFVEVIVDRIEFLGGKAEHAETSTEKPAESKAEDMPF